MKEDTVDWFARLGMAIMAICLSIVLYMHEDIDKSQQQQIDALITRNTELTALVNKHTAAIELQDKINADQNSSLEYLVDRLYDGPAEAK